MLLVRLFSQIRYSLLILSLALMTLTMKADESIARASAVANPMPGLQGQPAIDYLKQHGLFKSIKDAVEADRYEMHWVSEGLPERLPGTGHPGSSEGWQANNPNQNLQASFSRDGALIAPRQSCTGTTWQMALKLHSIGYGKRLSQVAQGPMRASGNRIEYARSVNLPNPQSAFRLGRNPQLTEWYVNKPEGIEQGFTLSERPEVTFGTEPLRLALSVTGGLRASLEDDGQAVALSFRDGRQALRYDHLAAFDALGRLLPVRMEVRGEVVALVVEDATAVYPVNIDPLFAEVKKLTASDAATVDEFGFSVGISADTIVVGADGKNSGTGAAYIFKRDQGGTGNWGQVKKLTASDATTNNYFGWSVGISGDTVVVGASGNSLTGAAYVYERNQGGSDNWGQVKKLTASDAAANDVLGGAVSISADTIVVGANGKNSGTGSAYIFKRNQGGTGNWGQVKKLTAGDAMEQDRFGSSVGISGDTVLVGASGKNSNIGAAYIYDRNQGGSDNWGQVKKITASDGASLDVFGNSVGISLDTVVVGGAYDLGGLGALPGKAYIFERNQGGPTTGAK